jgi:hypothetical protein
VIIYGKRFISRFNPSLSDYNPSSSVGRALDS